MYSPDGTIAAATAGVSISAFQEKAPAHLGKAGVNKKIKNTAKNLISHKNSEVKISNDHGTRVFDSIGKVPGRGEGKADHIQTEGEREEFSNNS